MSANHVSATLLAWFVMAMIVAAVRATMEQPHRNVEEDGRPWYGYAIGMLFMSAMLTFPLATCFFILTASRFR